MVGKVFSATVIGISAQIVEVEVDVSSGLPAFNLVGLPSTAVRESKERVRAAIRNCGLEFPPKRITINLAPAYIKKEGVGLDLPIAIALLIATNQLNNTLNNTLIAAELSLDGKIRPIRGILSIAQAAKNEKFSRLIVAKNNATEAALIEGIDVFAFDDIAQLVKFLKGQLTLQPTSVNISELFEAKSNYDCDFAEIKGQGFAKRALEVAAAGAHNLIMIGPPGVGKSMLAQRISTILPPLTIEEALEITQIHSSTGKLIDGLIATRPFIAPHHTATEVAIIGGGQNLQPGHVSLAHNGVLFLDELPEFSRSTLEALREPLENGVVTISRASGTLTLPARFMLVAAMNPCPCGYLGDTTHQCRCTTSHIQRYRNKISGPILDRIDIHLELSTPTCQELQEDGERESSATIRERVIAAHKLQLQRFKGRKIYFNSQMQAKDLDKYCKLSDGAQNLLMKALERFGLSARAYNKILKVARTIADLRKATIIDTIDIAEAIQYRTLDRPLEYY